MKFNRFFAFLAAASMLAVAASCDKEEKPDEPTPEPVVKSDACKLTALSLVAGGETIEGFV